MMLSFAELSRKLGISPKPWMIQNPFKIYEFSELVDQANLKDEDVVLDFGCGKGHWTIEVAQRCRKAIGIDISEKSISLARHLSKHISSSRIEFICARLEHAKLPSAFFDKILSFCVLEHISNLDEVLTEFRRILKPGGEIHASVDSLGCIKDASLIAQHAVKHHVVQYFTKDSLQQKLLSHNFEILEIYPIMTSDLACKEFTKRIDGSYKVPLVKRLQLSQRFRKLDNLSRGEEGIMLIMRARIPDTID